MDLQEYRDYVREQLDLEEEDLGNRLIDRWVSQGVMRITRFVQTWPFYETIVALPLLKGVSDYTTPLKEVRSIAVFGERVLNSVDETDAEHHWGGPSGVTPSTPQAFSQWGSGNVRIWPTPDANYQATVRGYRRPVTKLTEAGEEPDLPEDFHEVVLEWVLHQAYLHETDIEVAAVHKGAFDEMLRELTADEVSADPSHPIVFNGGISNGRRTNGWGDPLGPGLGGWGGGGGTADPTDPTAPYEPPPDPDPVPVGPLTTSTALMTSTTLETRA